MKYLTLSSKMQSKRICWRKCSTITTTTTKTCLLHSLPNSLLINGLVLNGSKSSICSPVPIKIIGLLVAATLQTKQHKIISSVLQSVKQRGKYDLYFLVTDTYALKAPPPFAWPSNLVTITEATSTLSLNALA